MNSKRQPVFFSLRTLCVLCVSALSFIFAVLASSKPPARSPQESTPFRGQSQEDADRKSSGCVSCHTSTDEPTMHPTRTVAIGCTDCHGGNASASIPSGATLNSPEYNSAKEKAHVQPRDASFKNRSSLPERTYTKWLAESAEYIKFVNPGDLRVAPETCGAAGCHAAETRWETSQPGNVLRVFERGGRKKAEIGNPTREEDPGKPDDKLSDRGFGTGPRTDPVFLGLQKTRLLDPVMSLPGTNDHPGDYRGSGCTACHVIYANDRDPAHSGAYARFGHSGFSASSDPAIPKNESGHPIKHVFTRSIPSSQCMICHIHPGTNMVTTYFGLTWWDNEIDGDKMYPTEQRNPSEEQRYQSFERNPEGAAVRGLWNDETFLEKAGSAEFNKQLKTTQFADFHGHGWIFRAVFNHDRKGNWLDKDGKQIAFDDPERFGKAVHLADIHLEKGMQCNDCHFAQDNHGNGKIYGEPRAAVEIDCIDCHGTIRKKAALITSGPAAPEDGRHLDALRTPWGLRRFEWREEKLFQRSMSEENKEWEIVQTIDTITPGNVHFSEKSLRAKLMSKDGSVPSQMPSDDASLAHANGSMTAAICK